MVRHAPELSGYRHEHGYRWSCKKLRSTPTRRRTVTNLESVHVKSIACFQSWTSVIACFMYMNTLQDIWEWCILWYLQWRILQIFKLRDQCHLIAVFGVLVLLIWNSVGIPAGIHPIPKQPWCRGSSVDSDGQGGAQYFGTVWKSMLPTIAGDRVMGQWFSLGLWKIPWDMTETVVWCFSQSLMELGWDLFRWFDGFTTIRRYRRMCGSWSFDSRLILCK